MLVRRVPGLQKKIIDVGLIDGADGGVHVGVSGQQCPLGLGKNPHALLQKLDAIHARHALVGQQQGHAVIPHLQLLQQIQRAFRRIAANHPVFGAIFRTQIALDRPQNIGDRHPHSIKSASP